MREPCRSDRRLRGLGVQRREHLPDGGDERVVDGEHAWDEVRALAGAAGPSDHVVQLVAGEPGGEPRLAERREGGVGVGGVCARGAEQCQKVRRPSVGR